jgi:phytoene desaturase
VAGLSCALHLRAAGAEVTVLERDSAPGGRQDAVLELDGYRFDLAPVQAEPACTPRAITETLAVVGERVHDWIELLPLEPVCRAHYPDGTVLDLHSDPFRTADGIRRLCGGPEARAYLRYRRVAGFRVPPAAVLSDPRTVRLFEAPALFGTKLLDNAWYPAGGPNAVTRALASVAAKHGVSLRYHAEVHTWETRGDRVAAVRTVAGERIAGDALVVPARRRSGGASHLVLHLGTAAKYTKAAHHNLHFGRAWRRTRHEVFHRGELMSDPTLLVSVPSVTDASAAGVLRVIVPVPNLRAAPVPWGTRATRTYCGEIMAFLEASGYVDLGALVRTSYVVTPADWAAMGMMHGVPGVGRKSPGTLHPSRANVVIAGGGFPSGRLAAQRVVGVL